MTLEQFIDLALLEDIGKGDHSSLSCIPNTSVGRAKLLVKQDGILAGVEVALAIFQKVDSTLNVACHLSDGDRITAGEIAFEVEGPSLSILAAERLVLNCMQKMSAIATKTNQMVELVAEYGTKILDTRKTTPLNRFLEKSAVKIGGGHNHRFGLYDMVMLKDNHIDYAGSIEQAIKKTKHYIIENELDLKIEIEARDLKEVEEILVAGGADRIMLDNFSFEDIEKAVAMIGDQSETEASGGIDESTIVEYAKRGVDYISVGALTHTVAALDLSLKAY